MSQSPEPVRLSKLMAHRGICSRREADRYIEAGQVKVDGEVISTLGIKVSPSATIELLQQAQKAQNNKVTILLNKPMGYVSTQPEKGYRAAIELITKENQWSEDPIRSWSPSHRKHLNVAGRLDIDSSGLLVLTQDGTVVKTLIGPDSQMEKEYVVGVVGIITEEKMELLRHGLELDGVPLKKAQIDRLGEDLLRFVLTEGKKRQIRRMCELVDLKVRKLKRVRIGKVHLGHLPKGQWRYL